MYLEIFIAILSLIAVTSAIHRYIHTYEEYDEDDN